LRHELLDDSDRVLLTSVLLGSLGPSLIGDSLGENDCISKYATKKCCRGQIEVCSGLCGKKILNDVYRMLHTEGSVSGLQNNKACEGDCGNTSNDPRVTRRTILVVSVEPPVDSVKGSSRAKDKGWLLDSNSDSSLTSGSFSHLARFGRDEEK
jgi:hypothetical protein